MKRFLYSLCATAIILAMEGCASITPSIVYDESTPSKALGVKFSTNYYRNKRGNVFYNLELFDNGFDGTLDEVRYRDSSGSHVIRSNSPEFREWIPIYIEFRKNATGNSK